MLSFPVHRFSRFVPRRVAIPFAFLILLAVLLLVVYVLAPLLLEQVGTLAPDELVLTVGLPVRCRHALPLDNTRERTQDGLRISSL
jgi:hypothetical protein